MAVPPASQLADLIHVAMRQSAASLAEILNQPVEVRLDQIHLVPMAALPQYLQDEVGPLGNGVRLDFVGEASGEAYFLLPVGYDQALIHAITGPEGSMAGLVEPGASVLLEVGNVILNACVGSLANQLARRVQYRPPEILVESGRKPLAPADLLGAPLPGQTWQVVSSRLRIGGLEISAFILICLNAAPRRA